MGLVNGHMPSLQVLADRAWHSLPNTRFLEALPLRRKHLPQYPTPTIAERTVSDERGEIISKFYIEADMMPLWRALTLGTLESGVGRKGNHAEIYSHGIPYAALVVASKEYLLVSPIYHHQSVVGHPDLRRSQLELEAWQHVVRVPFSTAADRNLAALYDWQRELGIVDALGIRQRELTVNDNNCVVAEKPYIVKAKLILKE